MGKDYDLDEYFKERGIIAHQVDIGEVHSIAEAAQKTYDAIHNNVKEGD